MDSAWRDKGFVAVGKNENIEHLFSQFSAEFAKLINEISGYVKLIRHEAEIIPMLQQKTILMESEMTHLRRTCAKCEESFSAKIKSLETKCENNAETIRKVEADKNSEHYEIKEEMRNKLADMDKRIGNDLAALLDEKLRERDASINNLRIKITQIMTASFVILAIFQLLLPILFRLLRGGGGP